MLSLILVVFALVLFVIAAWGFPAQPNPPRWNLIALGLAFYMASILAGSPQIASHL
jgi:hypothetical protein